MVIAGPAGRGVSVHACREPIHRFVSRIRETSRGGNPRPAAMTRGTARLEPHATLGALGSEGIFGGVRFNARLGC